MRALLIACALVALTACDNRSAADGNGGEAPAPAGPVKGVDRSHKGSEAPAVKFSDPDGRETNLAAYRGKPTLVNLWASWCAPCVKELPTLDTLAGSKGAALNVLAVSQDSGPHESVVAFLKDRKAATLKPYQDSKMALSGALGAEVLPTSILYDAQGREVWRYVGELDWTSPAAARLLADAGVR